jgi:hypothetical protein
VEGEESLQLAKSKAVAVVSHVGPRSFRVEAQIGDSMLVIKPVTSPLTCYDSSQRQHARLLLPRFFRRTHGSKNIPASAAQRAPVYEQLFGRECRALNSEALNSINYNSRET